MRKTRSLLLAGTVLPALILSGPSPARPFEDGGANRTDARVQLAQADEPRGGGRGGPGGPGGGPGGPGGGPGGAERGGPPRGGAERGGPPERAAPPAARERPEPREAPAARERPEPRQAPAARPDRDDKPEPRQAPKAQPKPDRDDDRPAAREKPEPRQAPAARPDRDDDRPSAREKPSAKPDRDDDKPAAREKPAARPDRDDDRPAREKPSAKPDRDDDKPSAREKPEPRQAPGARDRKDDRQKDDRDDDKPTTRERPGERPGDRTPSGQQRQDRDKQDRDRPDRQDRDKSDRDDRDDRPGRGGADRPNAPASPNAAQPGAPNQPVVPNQRPGVPGRPVQAPNATPPGQPQPNAQQPNAQQQPGDQRRDRFNTPGRAGYIPGGFRDDDDEFRDYGRVRRDRREYDVDGRSYYREPGRIIVRDRDNYYIRHDENERFRYIGREGYGGYGGYRTERRGVETYSYIDRPGGEQIITVVDDDGRLLRRSRRYRDGREVYLINNSYGPGGGGPRPIYEDVVDLPPPRIDIPRERYVVDYGRAEPRAVYGALTAPPVQPIERRYTLDQVRYSPQLRARMPSVDINTITFDSGAFTVAPDQARQLQTIADGINQAIQANPQEVFLIEGYTDAVGEPVDNLSLSDRRAQSVATILTQDFKVPPENLTTQGYGEQNLRVQTEEANRENRRVTVRRITPLLQQQGDQGEAPPK